jgi:hypothetical protein
MSAAMDVPLIWESVRADITGSVSETVGVTGVGSSPGFSPQAAATRAAAAKKIR